MPLHGKILRAPFAAAAAFLLAIHSGHTQAKATEPSVMLVCVSSLEDSHDTVLASRGDDGAWKEHAGQILRSSLVSAWLPAQAGELYIAVRQEGTLRSVGHFTLPEGAHRSLVVLIADKESKTYLIRTVDPVKEEFSKGTTLVFNFSAHTGLLSLGADEHKVEPNSQRVLKPVPDESGTYRMMASFIDVAGDSVLAFDRQVPDAPDARKMIFLIPDEAQAIRVTSLPLFGDLD
jgi:hypothetical protein